MLSVQFSRHENWLNRQKLKTMLGREILIAVGGGVAQPGNAHLVSRLARNAAGFPL